MWPPAPLGAHGVGFGDVNDARRRRDRADPPRRGQLVSPPAVSGGGYGTLHMIFARRARV